MDLPPQIINEIVAKARASRQKPRDREVPSPRGVADFQFDDNDTAAAAAAVRRTVRPFPRGQSAESVANQLGGEFLRDTVSRALVIVEFRRSMKFRPGDVTMAANGRVASDEAMKRNDDYNADAMDTDDTSEYGGSDIESESDDDSSLNDDINTTFDEAYPLVPNITISDRRFKDEVMSPLMSTDKFSRWSCGISLSASVAGVFKQVLYSYIVSKLSDQYDIIGQVEEASSLLELAVWKATINESGAETEGDRGHCRMNCRADIVLRNVLPYLFAGVINEN